MAGTNEHLRIWLLSDGAPGHVSQSRGVAEAIGRFRPVELILVPLRVRRKLLKSAGRWLLHAGGVFPRWLLQRVYDLDLPDGKPDVLISSGGNTLLANALLARQFGVPNLYSGTLKGYPARCYSSVYTVTPLGTGNNRVLPLPPVPDSLSQRLPAAPADAPWLLLIGGNGAGYCYEDADWRALAAAVNRLGKERGGRWLVTTSRRTGAAAEDLLQQLLDPAVLEETVYFGKTPKPVVRDFLARCRGVWVSEDSLTMVAEAIYSGRPVRSISPRRARPEVNDAAALAGYVDHGLLERSFMHDLATLELSARTGEIEIPDVQRMIWEDVQTLLPPGRLP